MGDPGGIGPEVLVKALADPDVRALARFRVYGSRAGLQAAAETAAIEPFWWAVRHGSGVEDTGRAHDVLLIDFDDRDGEFTAPREANKRSGELSFLWVERAIAAARLPAGDPMAAQGIVTGPINKAAWALAGHKRWLGHTDLLKARFRAKRVVMMFVAPTLRVSLATGHVGLMQLEQAINIGTVFDAIELTHEGCRRMGVPLPRIAVCGLNPHAGEGGLLGEEEQRLIEPAIGMAREQGIDASGAWPGDTVFNAAVAGKFDAVVAMYHDQGLIPVKLLARDEAVNVTLGLPVIRTSPDHGTAFDIAGENKAEPGSMIAAIRLAARMARASLASA